MKEYKVTINSNIDENDLKLVKEYWELNDKEFVHKISHLANEYKVTAPRVKKIAMENSSCQIIHGTCKECNRILRNVVYCRRDFKLYIWIPFEGTCGECEREINIRLKEEKRLKRIQYLKEKFEKGIEQKTWTLLSRQEFKILMLIVKFKKSNIIEDLVFNNSIKDKKALNILTKLENLDLVVVDNLNYSSLPRVYNFSDKLEDIIFKFDPINLENDNKFEFFESENHFMVNVLRNIRKEDGSRQPDYTSNITIKKSILLEEGVQYSFAGWVQENGSINLKIYPKDKK